MDSIPHVIHQIWIGPDPEPTMWTDTFRKDYLSANPDFSYKLWNNDNINELFTDFPIYKKVYDIEKTWNGKSDILRYLILYLYGGIYIDADSVWLGRSMNDLLNCKIFAGIEPNTNVITGGVIGSVKGNKLFLDIIKHIENYIISNGNIKYYKYKRLRSFEGASKILGPTLFNKYANGNITVYPSHYFYPITWHGITDINYHKTHKISAKSYMFQYGYTTNNLKDKI